MTLSSFTADDGRLEFLMKAQSTPMECGSIELSYHPGHPRRVVLQPQRRRLHRDAARSASVTLPTRRSVRRARDGRRRKVMVYQNGHRLGTWDSTGSRATPVGRRIGFEMDGIVDVLAFSDFGGGGQ